MKITFRLILSLLLAATIVAVGFSFYQENLERTRLIKELNRQAIILTASLTPAVNEMIGSLDRLKRFIDQVGPRENFVGFAVYNKDGELLAANRTVMSNQKDWKPLVLDVLDKKSDKGLLVRSRWHTWYIFITPVTTADSSQNALLLMQDASGVPSQLTNVWRNNFIRLIVLSLFIIVTTVFVVRWNITRPIEQISEWIRDLTMGTMLPDSKIPSADALGKLGSEVSKMAQSLSDARSAAGEEARLRITHETTWTAEKLKEYIRKELGGKLLYVISNREPYMHNKPGEYIMPAGGLVTALDPIMRACSGVWLAHGSGDADRETADANGKIQVPPGEPQYTLKRIWLTKEEEDGYYYGFSNEALWPLCHITHTRPIFRLDDWLYYQKVNEKFADALLEEISGETDPLVLIQDYHFCLLPYYIKSRKPDCRVAIFWHIPWPNSEVFSICPWKEEILTGILGADLIGFHTQYFCNNFLETVDVCLESKINWENFTVERKNQISAVRPFPISVSTVGIPDMNQKPFDERRISYRADLLRENNLEIKFFGVGVDRVDYTKGINERFLAIERFFDKYPAFQSTMSFFQIGSPSRTRIKRYQELTEEIDETVNRINKRFQSRTWKPIIYLKGHYSHAAIAKYYTAADFCMVTSLHDGMNLVAKEYIAAREDWDGALILSEFTGAARELPEAQLVNPYSIESMAEAIHTALTMPPLQRRERMRHMRQTVLERNVFRWAGNLVSALARMKIPQGIVGNKR